MVYRHTSEMGEISGFGGGYEILCQNMLEAGVNWLLANPDVSLEVSSFKDVYGFIKPENDGAKILEEVLLKASDNDCTGAMMHNVMARLFFIKANGWDEYKKQLIAERLNDKE